MIVKIGCLIKFVFQGIVHVATLQYILVWSLPLIVNMWKCIAFMLIRKSSVSCTRHILAISFCYLFHRNLIRLWVLFSINACPPVLMHVRFRFLKGRVAFASRPSLLLSVIIFNPFAQLVLATFIGLGFLHIVILLMLPVPQVHVFFELQQLLHFGFAFDSSDMLPEPNLQMLQI